FFSSSSFLNILSILLLSAAARQAAQAGLPAAADRNKRQPRKQRDAERAPGEPAVLDRVGAQQREPGRGHQRGQAQRQRRGQRLPPAQAQREQRQRQHAHGGERPEQAAAVERIQHE